MSRAIYEAESDGSSVILWEAGSGSRVYYPSNYAAEIAYNWLVTKAAELHNAKDALGVAVTEAFGEDMTSFELVRHYFRVCEKYGYRVEEGCMTREPAEFW